MTIYVELLDEGTKCWRPVSAEHISDDVYRVLDFVPEGKSGPSNPAMLCAA